MPKALGMDGPVMSASKMATDLPCFALPTASSDVTRDLPTPPLPLTMPMTFLTLENSFVFSLTILDAQSFPQDSQSCVHSLIYNSLRYRANFFVL